MFLPIKLCCLNQLWIIGSIIVMTNKQCMNLTQHIFIAQYKLLTEITFQFHWWTLAVGNRMFGICCIVLWPEHPIPTLVLSKTTWALESCIAPNYLHKSNHRNTGLFINWFPYNTHSYSTQLPLLSLFNFHLFSIIVLLYRVLVNMVTSKLWSFASHLSCKKIDYFTTRKYTQTKNESQKREKRKPADWASVPVCPQGHLAVLTDAEVPVRRCILKTYLLQWLKH